MKKSVFQKLRGGVDVAPGTSCVHVAPVDASDCLFENKWFKCTPQGPVHHLQPRAVPGRRVHLRLLHGAGDPAQHGHTQRPGQDGDHRDVALRALALPGIRHVSSNQSDKCIYNPNLV